MPSKPGQIGLPQQRLEGLRVTAAWASTDARSCMIVAAVHGGFPCGQRLSGSCMLLRCCRAAQMQVSTDTLGGAGKGCTIDSWFSATTASTKEEGRVCCQADVSGNSIGNGFDCEGITVLLDLLYTIV